MSSTFNKPCSTEGEIVAGNLIESGNGFLDKTSSVVNIQGNGVTLDDIKLLQDSGYLTIESVAFSAKKEIASIPGITDRKADRILMNALSIVPMGFITGYDVLDQRTHVIKITTGSGNFDTLLGGGLEAGCITECFGESGTGKTQLCHVLAVSCQLPFHKFGAEGKCMYIDSEGSFRSERIVSICKRFDLNEKDVLDKILYARSYNTDHQIRLLYEAMQKMSESRCAVLVVDGFMSLYRSEYSGKDEIWARQQHLGRFMKLLHKICDQLKVAVVITNQMVANIEGSGSECQKPAGGNTVAYSSTNRIHLKKCQNDERTCTMYKSPWLPTSSISFAITERGIEDANAQ